MSLKHYRQTKGQIRATNIPTVTKVPGSSWGRVPQQNIRVEKKEDGSTNIDKVLEELSDEQRYSVYGGIVPYTLSEVPQLYGHPDLEAGQLIHKLPFDKTPVTFQDDLGDTGKKIVTANEYGIVHIMFRDENNHKKFAEIIVNPRIREGDVVKSSITLFENDGIELSFYAGWIGSHVTWTNPQPTKIGIYPSNVSGHGRGNVVRVVGLEAGGPYVVNVNGRQSTSAQLSVLIKVKPT